MKFVCTGVLAALGGWLLSGSVGAQDDQAVLDFGKGVHAYFAGHLQQADTYFTQAIGDGTVDPRPYYFRGLTRELLGQTAAGREDYAAGAKIEAAPGGRAFDVGGSLERVQGKPRVQLEKIRREVLARLRPQVQRESDGMVQFEAQRKLAQRSAAEAGSLDPRKLPGVDTLIDPTIPFQSTEATVPPPNIVDPNAQPEMVDDTLPPPSTPPASKPSGGDDPFGDSGDDASPPPADKQPPAASDASGTDSEAPAPPKPADKKNDDDPFGG